MVIAKFYHELLGSTADISTKMQFLLEQKLFATLKFLKTSALSTKQRNINNFLT